MRVLALLSGGYLNVYTAWKSCLRRLTKTLEDRFSIYVNVIHKIQMEHDTKLISSIVVTY